MNYIEKKMFFAIQNNYLGYLGGSNHLYQQATAV